MLALGPNAMRDLVLANLTVTIPERELEWTAVRASGPGGQNVNKVSTKVELRFDFEESASLSDSVKARLRASAKHRLDAEGRILITSQVTRTQPQNLEDARKRLAELIAKAMVTPKRRRPTKPSRAAKRARVNDKRVHSKKKQSRARKTSDD
jgi:ribosome-associated protein